MGGKVGQDEEEMDMQNVGLRNSLGVEKEAEEKPFRGRENPKRGTSSFVSWKEAG